MPSDWEFDYVESITDNSEIKVSIDLDITGSGGFAIAENASALSLDVDQAAAQLTRSGTGWASSNVTYSFFTSSAQVSYNLDPGGLGNASITAPSAALQSNVSYAISLWDDIVATDFSEVAAGTGSINIGYAQDWATDSSGNAVPNYASAAYAWYPGTWGDQAGDVWVNQFTMSGADWSNYYDGEWGIVTTVHEVGHAIGLSHPGDYNATPGQSITYTNSAAYIEDSMQYSIMSYFRASETGADLQPTIGRYQHPESPLLHDITAAQLIYGAEMSTRAGDTTYGFNSTAGRDLFDFNLNTDPALAIWDAGGIDTLDLSGYVSSVTIDLRATYFSSTPGLSNNIAIAKNVVIENAVGTIAADLIVGNSSDNRIVGNGGGDTVDAGLGSDTYVAAGASSTYTSISGNNVSAVLERDVNGRAEFTNLSNVEFIEFSDQTIALGGGTSNSVSISDAILNEGDTGTSIMSFVVNLGSASGSNISVDYSVIGNSATNGIDFTAAATGTLVIAAGATTGTIDIVVNGDTDFEADEQLTVILTGSAGAVLGRATATGTIINDDAVVADDVGATVGTAEALPINSAFSREIEVTGDRDWFEVSLVNGQSYVFEARGSGYSTASATLADPYLRLLDASGNVLASNNDGLGGLSARIDLSNFALASGNYYLEVSANNDAYSGTYQVAASSTSTVSTSIISVPTITAIYEGQSGNLSLTFDAPLPTAVEISLLAVAGSAIAADYIVPTTISLAPGQSSASIPLTAFDDALSESDETFDITLSITSGSAFFDSPAGNVTSISTSVTIVDNDYGADDYDATIASTTQLIGSERRGELEIDGDHDWFRIDVTDLTNAYLFEIDAAGGGGGSLDDGFLVIRDSNGDVVAFDDDSGADRDSQLTFVPTATGTYFIDVGAYNDFGSGSYTVRATEIPIPETDIDARGVTSPTRVSEPFLSTQSLNFGSDDLDVWQVTAQSTGTLLVTANNLTFDADIAIYDSSGTYITDATASGNNNEYLAISVTAGSQYFVVGIPFSGSGYYTIGAMVIGIGENPVFTNGDRALTSGEHHLISETSRDTILSGNGLDNQILANTGDDTIFGFAGDDTIRAGIGDDLIDGGEGSDNIDAGRGDDTVRIWDSSVGDFDTANASSGTDTLDFSQFGSAVWVTLDLVTINARTRDSSDLLTGTWRNIANTSSFEIVIGTNFADELIGNGLSNTLSGNSGDDLFYGRGSNDVIDGGTGIDTAKYDFRIDEYSYSLSGNDIIITGANEGTDTVYDNVEFFEFSSGTVSRSYLLSGLTPLIFTTGADVVDLSFLGGTFDALGGDDVLSYKGGTIDVDGNSGSDTIDFSSFGSAIEINLASTTGVNFRTQDLPDFSSNTWRNIGSSSNVENIIGTEFDDRLFGDFNGNFIFGGDGNDYIQGRSGNNVLDGGDGGDNIAAGSGNDLIRLWEHSPGTAKYIDGSLGVDTVDFTNFNYAVWVDFEYIGSGINAWTRDATSVTSGVWRGLANLNNIENLTGSAFADYLGGDADTNTLLGLAGDDRLEGRGGNDIIDGGADTDTAVFANNFSTYNFSLNGNDILVTGAGEGTDTVRDSVEFFEFSSGTISRGDLLAGLVAPTFTAGDDVVTLPIFGGTFDALGGNDQLSYMGGTVSIDGNTGVDGVDFSGFGSAVWVDLGFPGTQAWTRDGSDLNSGAWRSLGSLSNVENLTGTAHNDYLGGDGNANTFTYTGGRDTVDGKGGSDTAAFTDYNFAVWVDLEYIGTSFNAWTRNGSSVTSGTWSELANLSNVENLTGSALGDYLSGDTNDNILLGLSGNDRLEGRGGNDIIDGGDFTDTVVYANAIDTYGIATSGTDILITGAGEGTDIVRDNVELFEFSSGTVSRSILLSGLNSPILTSGANTVSLPFLGGTFDALGGNDVLSYRGGTIIVDGNTGSDTMSFADYWSAVWVDLDYAGSQAWTKDGTDLSSGPWRALGSLSNIENLTGTAHNDYLGGDGNANTFTYTGGRDTIDGKGGSDAIDFSGFGSAVWVDLDRSGADAWTRGTMNVTSGSWQAIGDLSNIEDIVGTSFADELRGNANANRLLGGAGNDILSGEGGNDTFVFDFGDGMDTIGDFELNIDTIDFSSIAGISSIGDLGISQDGTDALIQFGAGDQIRLSNIDFLLLDSDDFLF